MSGSGAIQALNIVINWISIRNEIILIYILQKGIKEETRMSTNPMISQANILVISK